MLTVKVEGLENLKSRLSDLEKTQFPFAVALALTRTARKAKTAIYGQFRSKFDRPTPFIMDGSIPGMEGRDDQGSLRVEKATPQRWSAMVKLKDFTDGKQKIAADPLLRHHFFGGTRVHKVLERELLRLRFMDSGEYIVPGAAAKLDRYGNISGGQIQQIRSQLRIETLGASNSASNSRRSKANQARAGVMFWSYGNGTDIARKPTQRANFETGRYETGRIQHLPKGLYVRDGRHVHPILFVIKGAPTYKKLFDLQQIAADALRQHFNTEFKMALRDAVKHSGYKGKWTR